MEKMPQDLWICDEWNGTEREGCCWCTKHATNDEQIESRFNDL